MELWDAYTKNGVRTGGVLLRGERLWPGLYHLVCEVLVRHIDGSFLCMIRSKEKPNYPGFPECSAGGSALLGEDPLECIRRELREETGVVCEDFEPVARTVREKDHAIFYSFVCTVDCPKDCVKLQPGETEGYEWLSRSEFIRLVNSDRMIPEQMERMGPWYRKMGYLK